MRYFFCFIISLSFINLQAQNSTPSITGQLIIISSFPSKFVDPRDIFVWLPGHYDSSHRYSVLYMHDGQMLFDSTKTWNGQEWHVDEIMQQLLDKEEIEETIVVGIPNNGLYRNSEYFPQAVLDDTIGLENLRKEVLQRWMKDVFLADRYLQFIVEELKPYIDLTYPTCQNRKHTFMMGSSMGGLISLYALCEYPKTFGGVACLSTHWPLLNPVPTDMQEIKYYEFLFLKFHGGYLHDNLPSPENHKIYLDHGTETLDSLYGPYQGKINKVLMAKGYNSKHWVTKVYEGAVHSEASWSKRLDTPIRFLLGK